MTLSKTVFIFAVAGCTLLVASCKKKGCTDPKATNYDSKAKKDDGSCNYPTPTTPSTPTNPAPTDSSKTPPNEKFTSLQAYWKQKAIPTETTSFDAATGTTFQAKKGTKITIPPNVLITHDGQAVTGMVDLRVKEIFSASDMIFSRVFPVSSGQVLNSGGEFYIQTSQNGQPLLIKDNAFLKVDLPAQAPNNQMQLFLAGPIEAIDTVDWVPIDSNMNTQSKFTFKSSDNSYSIDLDSLGWGNIDAFDRNIKYFNCQFDLTGVTGLSHENTTAFAVFKDMNTVWPVGERYFGKITNNSIQERHLADVPLNLVVISVVDGQLYSGLLDVTPQQGTTYSITMQKTTSVNLDKMIEALP